MSANERKFKFEYDEFEELLQQAKNAIETKKETWEPAVGFVEDLFQRDLEYGNRISMTEKQWNWLKKIAAKAQ